ncbi:MAG: radical SAM protein [Candidatus Omnitrophica bacterium]|nr:radical SAM protein [Candidatus Omnitrophota bacterium]
MTTAFIRPQKISGAFEKILIQEPVNLAYLAAYLKQQGFPALIWDFEAEDIPDPVLARRLTEEQVSIAAFTAMTPTINNAHQLAVRIKKINPRIVTVIGGPHASALPEETLRDFPGFDYAVIGEGEEPMARLCRCLRSQTKAANIPGIASRAANGINIEPPAAFITELDRLPFPDRSLFERRLYKNIYAAGITMKNKRATVAFTSRGCPYHCTFCAVKKTLGQSVRFRSAENVLEELKECRDRYGYNHITFEDTSLTINPERFLRICRGLKNLGLTWDCQTRVNLVTEPLLLKMKECGCLKVAYGVESGSQKILDLMKKDITVGQIEAAFRATKKAGMVTCAFFILGTHPEETAGDIRLTEQLLHRIRPDVFQLGIICPYPGTEIHDIMQQEHLIGTIDWKDFNFMHSRPRWRTKYVSAEELVRRQKAIYTRYLTSPGFVITTLKNAFRPGNPGAFVKLALAMLRYLIFENRR